MSEPRASSPPDVFLVTCDRGTSFRHVGERIFYGRNLVRSAPYAGSEARFSAVAEGGKCRVEWLDASPSVLPGGARTALLENGAEFTDGGARYLVYVERAGARWVEPTDSSPSDDVRQLLTRLGALPAVDLQQAGRRFLQLPYVDRWWSAEFEDRTGFEQCRDGRVPRVRRCEVLVGEQHVQLAWEVAVFDLFDSCWDPDRERAPFTRLVGGVDLSALWSCASKLTGIPVDTCAA